MPKEEDQPELWIGLVEFKPLDRKACGAAGVFTNIVTWTVDLEGFQRKAETIAATLEMYVADVEGAEHRIIFTHHLGVIQIVGQGLEVLADLIRRRQIAEIHMGAQSGGGNVKRIILDMGK